MLSTESFFFMLTPEEEAQIKLRSIQRHLEIGLKNSKALRFKAQSERDAHGSAFFAGCISELEWILDLHFGIKQQEEC